MLFIDWVNKKKNFAIDLVLVIVMFFLLDRFFGLSFFENDFADLRYGIFFFIPFMVGMLLRKYKNVDAYLEHQFTPLFFIYLVMLFLLYCKMPEWNGISLQLVSRLFISTVGSLLFVQLVKTMPEGKLESLINRLGKKTMEIYILHGYFLIGFHKIGVYWTNTTFSNCIATQILFSLLATAFSILCSLCLSWIIEKSKLFSLILFGKR